MVTLLTQRVLMEDHNSAQPPHVSAICDEYSHTHLYALLCLALDSGDGCDAEGVVCVQVVNLSDAPCISAPLLRHMHLQKSSKIGASAVCKPIYANEQTAADDICSVGKHDEVLCSKMQQRQQRCSSKAQLLPSYAVCKS